MSHVSIGIDVLGRLYRTVPTAPMACFTQRFPALDLAMGDGHHLDGLSLFSSVA
jgi:hypothetical protein